MTDIEKQALAEFEQEKFRGLVEAEKQRLRTNKTWWQRIFRFRIQIRIVRY